MIIGWRFNSSAKDRLAQSNARDGTWEKGKSEVTAKLIFGLQQSLYGFVDYMMLGPPRPPVFVISSTRAT